MAQELIREALSEIDGAIRQRLPLGRSLAVDAETSGKQLAEFLPADMGDELWHRATQCRTHVDARLDEIEMELRSQAGRLEGLLLQETFCSSVGGAEAPGVRPSPGRPRNEDRGGIVVDVRGMQIGWVFDGANCCSGYSCEHELHWFGDQLSAAIADIANRDTGDDLRGVLEAALTRVAEQTQGCGGSGAVAGRAVGDNRHGPTR